MDNNFLSLINDHIYLDVKANNSHDLFKIIANILKIDTTSFVSDNFKKEIIKSLMAREELGSTGLGFGVAVPHGRINNLNRTLVSILKTSQPIQFNAPDDKPVDLFIFILVPEHATQEHLNLLSKIATMLSDEEIREGIKSAQTKEDIL